MKGDNYSLATELKKQGFSYPEIFRFLVNNAGLDYDSALHVIRILDINSKEKFQKAG
jgi:hypothetical protein